MSDPPQSSISSLLLKKTKQLNCETSLIVSGLHLWRIPNTKHVMNQLDPVEELYNMYLEEEDTLKIVEVVEDGLDFNSDLEGGPLDPYLEL